MVEQMFSGGKRVLSGEGWVKNQSKTKANKALSNGYQSRSKAVKGRSKPNKRGK
jgi:hypothetical protein